MDKRYKGFKNIWIKLSKNKIKKNYMTLIDKFKKK